jgi:hypothetical protein
MPGRRTWPESAINRVPGDVSVPTEVKASTPWWSSHGRFDSVSTLFTIVGRM